MKHPLGEPRRCHSIAQRYFPCKPHRLAQAGPDDGRDRAELLRRCGSTWTPEILHRAVAAEKERGRQAEDHQAGNRLVAALDGEGGLARQGGSILAVGEDEIAR